MLFDVSFKTLNISSTLSSIGKFDNATFIASISFSIFPYNNSLTDIFPSLAMSNWRFLLGKQSPFSHD